MVCQSAQKTTNIACFYLLIFPPFLHSYSMCVRRKNEGKSIHIRSFKFSVYFTKKKNFLFLFYTSTFTKYLHQFIYSTHLSNKIFNLLHFLLFSSLSSLLFGTLSQTQHKPKITHTQPPTTDFSVELQPPQLGQREKSL